jgi:hypothetical protein
MTRVVRNLALLVLALVARQARAQDMPPQCDVQEILYPQSMVFMGPAQSIQAGKTRNAAPQPACNGRSSRCAAPTLAAPARHDRLLLP